MSARLPRVLLLGPARNAVSGVSTHLNQLFGSTLPVSFELGHFRVGSEGRKEGKWAALLRALASPIAFAAYVASRRPRIVHLNTSIVPKAFWRDLAYFMIAKALRRRVIYQVHGGALPADFFAGRRMLSALLRRVLSSADVVVLLSRRELEAYREFAPSARLTLIANAVDIPKADLSAGRYAPDRPLEVVYLGRLATDKGVYDVVEALRVLRHRGIDANLRIAGHGPAEPRLRERIAAYGLEVHAQLLGTVVGPEKQRLWQAAHVFAFPTVREGLPYALLESMAAGAVPVVAPVGAVPEVLQDGVHGLFVPPRDPEALADALERLHRDRAALRRMAIAGRQRIVEHYSIARLAADFQRVYAGLAPSRAAARQTAPTQRQTPPPQRQTPPPQPSPRQLRHSG